MKKNIKLVVYKVFYIFNFIICIIKDFKKVFSISTMELYYPEKKRKKYLRIKDNLMWLFKHGEANIYYNLFGLDIIGSNPNEYCYYKSFMKNRNKYNMNINTYKEKYNYICLLRDKLVFERYMHSINIKTPETIAIIKYGITYDTSLEKELNILDIIKNKKKVFIKSIGGECGDGVYYIDSEKKYNQIDFSKGIFVVQKKIVQNEEINKMNPNSTNTIRIVTIKKDNKISIFASTLRIRTKKSGNVDNWSLGGIAVPINENGTLMKYGFYEPGMGTKSTIHPDTNFQFENFQIPYYDEVKKMVLKIHYNLYNIHSIGYDVAITPDGPIIIEANDNWGLTLLQLRGGLKNEWKKSMR